MIKLDSRWNIECRRLFIVSNRDLSSILRRADHRFVENLLSVIAVRSRRTWYDETFLSLSLSLSSSFSRSSLLSLSSRLCSSPLVWPPRVAGDQREWLSRIPVPLRRTDRAGSVCKTERQAHRFPDRRSPTRCRFWRSAGKDPNSMQLLPARYLGEGGSRECAATHYNAWRRFSLSMSRHSARRRFALQCRVKR